MDWIQFARFVITVGGLFLWNRSEANADRRELKNSIDALKNSTDAQIGAIQTEIKDFHGRLCALEEKYLQSRK